MNLLASVKAKKLFWSCYKACTATLKDNSNELSETRKREGLER